MLFIIYGAMLIQDEAGNIVAKLDAGSHLHDWPAALRAQGSAVPSIIEGGHVHYSRP